MVRYGQIVKARISDKNERHFFAQYEGETFTVLPGQIDIEKYQVGDQIEGLIYETKARKKVIQIDLPTIRPEVYGWGSVVSTRKDLGVFVDIGLQDKEVVVSVDDLPLNTALWPKKGDRLFLTYQLDAKNRFWGKLIEPEAMQAYFKRAARAMKNLNVTATVYKVKLAGSLCITDGGHSAFLHESETLDTPRLGQVLQARIIGVREDGGLNLSVKPRAYEALDDDAGMIQAILRKVPGHYLPLHDKSDPASIQAQLGISKAQFKRAVGTLMKQGIIRQVKGDGLYLTQVQDSSAEIDPLGNNYEV